jgi:hypothetical protein
MQNPESSNRWSSREELMTAINEAAMEKILELNEHYADVPELEAALEAAVHRIRTEQLNFHNVHTAKILSHGTNTFENVFEIFMNRIDVHCMDLYEAASHVEKNEHKPGTRVQKIRKDVKKRVKKAA